MICTPIQADGFPWIVCSGGRMARSTCSCGNKVTRLCDWKVGQGRTCDTGMCGQCTTSPAKDKDLCSGHAESWQQMQAIAAMDPINMPGHAGEVCREAVSEEAQRIADAIDASVTEDS